MCVNSANAGFTIYAYYSKNQTNVLGFIQSKTLDAHVQYRSNGEIFNRIFYGEAIKQFESLPYHDFVAEPQNLKFMLASDGI